MTETEERILATLISRGGAGAGTLARLAGIKRPTVYAALSNLCDLGVVTVHRAPGARQYRPAPKDRLKKHLLEDAQRRYKEAVESAGRLADRLAAIQQKAPQRVAGYELHAHESRAAVRNALEEKFLRGGFSAIFNPQLVLHAEIKKVVERCLKEHARTKPSIRELCIDGPLTREYIGNIRNPNHEVRILDSKVDLKTDMIFRDGTVTLMHYDLDNEFAVQIAHGDLFTSMMAIFEQLWTGSKPRIERNSGRGSFRKG